MKDGIYDAGMSNNAVFVSDVVDFHHADMMWGTKIEEIREIDGHHTPRRQTGRAMRSCRVSTDAFSTMSK
jgi:hypothetical protein